MRRIVVICIFSVIVCSAQCKITNLPFTMPPTPAANNPCYAFWCKDRPLILNTIWSDFQLTIAEQPPLPNEDGDGGGWFENSYVRNFPSGSSDYTLSLIAIGAGDYGKYMLVLMTSDYECLDALEVGVYHTTKEELVSLKCFKIEENRGVSVYQLRPVSEVPIMAYDSVEFPLKAQRIDTHYYIESSTGEFVLTNEKIYEPQDYTKEQFGVEYKIWEGGERDVITEFIVNCFFEHRGEEKDVATY